MDGAEMARVSEFVRNGETRASEQRGAIAQGCRGAFERGYRQNMGQSHAQPSKRARALSLSLSSHEAPRHDHTYRARTISLVQG
jgi:hypothetical protein